ncbi:MAG: sugar phosphate isomerase/epimerase [Kiritimatiellia bacterium]|jgi:sugar phosphate isomerase/epimerase
MGHQQTNTHRAGKASHHQIGLVRGQFGDVTRADWLRFLSDTGFDGYEECSWLLELDRLEDDAGADALAAEYLADARAAGLEIFALSVHLQGQALGDEPSAKTLPFVGGAPVAAYTDWRAAGNEPPRNDPYYVPEEVGRLLHAEAERQMLAAVRFARALSEQQSRKVPLTGFVGSPARCWSHWFAFPPLPAHIGGHPIPDVRHVSLELLAERFGTFFEACRTAGLTFDLECHPGERAMGDLESAGDYLNVLDAAGFADVVGFNLDCSHLEWQGVSGVAFIREFSERIHSVHLKGVWVADGYTRAGRLGGHRPMGHPANGWNFTTAASARDAVNTEEIIVELNRIGYDGALNIEWEDNDVDRFAGAAAALRQVRACDLPPSGIKHDDMLNAESG